ncbi:MAG: nucleotidyltransferase family protein [Candidatus Woesearchaeota archaeon]
MKLVLPIAGKGTRMRPLTHTTHKALIPIANKPVVQHIIDSVRETPNLEVSEIIFITGHLEEQIQTWAKKAYPELPLRFVHQEVQNGTAHALKLIKEYVNEDLLIIFPDALIDADLQVITEEKADGVIWCQEVENPQNYGVVAHDENMFMTELLEKPDEPPSNLVNIGVYYLKDYQSMFAMIDMLYEHEIKAKGEYNFPEALDLMVKNGKEIKVVPVEGWYDCGTLANTLRTNKIFCERAGIENLSSVSEEAILNKSTVYNTIVLENARISNCDLENSIVGEASIIKNTKGQIIVGSDAHINGND